MDKNHTIIDEEISDLLRPYVEGDISSAHDARIRAKIERALAKKVSGEMKYHSLDDVMCEFGFNAR